MENSLNIPSSFPPPGTPLPVPLIINEPPRIPLAQVSHTESTTPTGKYLLMRSNEFGDKVFLLRRGKRHWISTAEKLTELGYTFKDVVKVPDEELTFYPEAEVL